MHGVQSAAPVHVPLSTSLLLHLQGAREQPGVAGVCEVLTRVPWGVSEERAAHAAREEILDLWRPFCAGGGDEEEGEEESEA